MNDFGHAVLDRLQSASIGGGIAIGIALLATLLLRRLPPAVLSWVWRLALLKVFVGFLWLSPLEIRVLGAVAPAPPGPATYAAETTRAGSAEPNTRASQQTGEDEQASESFYLGGLWLLGVLGLGIVRGRRWRRANRFVRACATVDDPRVGILLAELCRIVGVRRRPKLRCSEEPISPVLIHPARPTIVVPKSLLQPDRATDLRVVILHELCHVKRLDLWWTAAFGCARILLLFHPLMWVSGRPWSLAQEAACDSHALRVSGGGREAYGDVLLRLMRAGEVRLAGGLTVVPDLGQKAMLARRLLWIERSRPLSRLAGVLLGIVGLLTVAVGIVPWHLAPSSHLPGRQQPELRAVGQIDWSTPKLAADSPAESGGFRVLGLQRVHDGGSILVIGDKVLYSELPQHMTTAIWISIPLQYRETHPNKYQFIGDDLTFSVAAASGIALVPEAQYAIVRPGGAVDGSVACVELPIGYPDDVRSLTLTVLYKGAPKVHWTLTDLPRTPLLLPADAKLVRELTVHGLKFQAMALRDHKDQFGLGSDMISWGVECNQDPPTGEEWSVNVSPVMFDRAATPLFIGTNGYSYVLKSGHLRREPTPGGAIAPAFTLPAFSSSLKLAKMHAVLTRSETFSEVVELTGLSLEPSRTASAKERGGGLQVVNLKERKLRTPSGMEFTLPKQGGDTELATLMPPNGENFYLLLTTPHDAQNLRLPESPLFRRHHKPLRVTVEAQDPGYVKISLWKDGRIELGIHGDRLKPGLLPPLRLKFTQWSDIEIIPMEFIVPIEDRAVGR